MIVGVLSYFIFVRSFEAEWFGPGGAEKLKLNSIDQKLGSEYTDSGYHERIKKLDEKPGVSGIQNQKPSDKPGCFQQELILILYYNFKLMKNLFAKSIKGKYNTSSTDYCSKITEPC